jgi:aminoglycoside phosphotransferase (APT) family kinase protein
MDRVEGQVPNETPSYHQTGWLSAATPAQRERLWWSAVAALGALHRVDVATAGFGYLTEVHWGMPLDADPVEHRIRQWRDFVAWSSPDDKLPGLLADMWDILLERRPPAPPSLSINWGDAKLTNMMVAGFDVAALLDWELCGIGAAEEDLAHLLMIDWLLSLSGEGRRLDGLPSRDETIAGYQRALGRPVVGVDWWFSFSVARVTTHAHRMMVRQRSLGLLPADVDLGEVNSMIPLLAYELARGE